MCLYRVKPWPFFQPCPMESINSCTESAFSEFLLTQFRKWTFEPLQIFKIFARESFWLKKSEFWGLSLKSWKLNTCANFGKIWRLFDFKSQRQIFKRRWLLKIWRAYRRGCRGKKMAKNRQKFAQNGYWCAKTGLLIASPARRNSSQRVGKGRFSSQNQSSGQTFLSGNFEHCFYKGFTFIRFL